MEIDTSRQLARGHTYNNIISRDHAQVHLGDKHNYGDSSSHSHNYYFCSSSSQQSSQALTLCGHETASERSGSELLSLKRKRSPDENEYTRRLNKEESLEHVLSKLGKFSKSIQDQRIGKDAKKIARRIALAINTVKRQAGLAELSELQDTHIRHDEDDFEDITNSLTIAKRVDVNTEVHRKRYTKLTRVTRKCDSVRSGQWEISLKSSTFEYRNADGTELVESLASLYFEPRIPGSGLPVTVHLGETRTHKAVSFINPVILACRVIPDESEVFEVIKEDDLEGLVRLLADGKATIRDCDERGATLLHYACKCGSPRCCQYLVDKRVDFERFTTAGWRSTPLMICANGGYSMPDFSRERDLVPCGEILLKSGADPTVTSGGGFPPLFITMFNTPALLDSMLVEGLSFLDAKGAGFGNQSLWLQACTYVPHSCPSVLQRFVDAGCDIVEKDHRGYNCLYHSVFNSNHCETSEQLERLQYLLSIFDDIDARDTEGRTIFDHVDDAIDGDYPLRGYQRDLWYCALERASIDISHHVANHPRKPIYDYRYTPEYYHALKHLQSWNVSNFGSQMDRLLQEIPLDEEEAREMERVEMERGHR